MKNKAECRAIDEPLPPEFLEALNLCTKLISVRATGDPDRLTAANDSLRADLLGDPPVPTLISAADQPVVTLLHSFLELMQVPNHFKAMATMVRLYPWGGKISRSQHMESCYYLIVHETYILEERLKAFTKALIECATSQSFEVDLSSAHKYAIKLHNAFFGEMVAARGIHVHQRSYVPREIKRLPQHDTSPEAMGIKKWRRNEARRITLTVHSFDRDTGGGIFEVGGPAKRVPLGKPTFPKLPNMPSACDRPLCAQVGRMARLHACLLNEFSMLLAAEIGHHSGNVLLV